MFNSLIHQSEPEESSSGAYLWQRVQSDKQRLAPVIESELRDRVKQLQSAKKRMILERLWTRNYEHPSFDTLDLSDESSVHQFLARENIKCGLICDPFQPLTQLEMLCNIIKGTYDRNIFHVHISIFRWYPEAKTRGDSKEDLVTYFKVNLVSAEQNGDERRQVINELKGIIWK